MKILIFFFSNLSKFLGKVAAVLRIRGFGASRQTSPIKLKCPVRKKVGKNVSNFHNIH
jgi:hypothetical protein